MIEKHIGHLCCLFFSYSPVGQSEGKGWRLLRLLATGHVETFFLQNFYCRVVARAELRLSEAAFKTAPSHSSPVSEKDFHESIDYKWVNLLVSRLYIIIFISRIILKQEFNCVLESGSQGDPAKQLWSCCTLTDWTRFGLACQVILLLHWKNKCARNILSWSLIL